MNLIELLNTNLIFRKINDSFFTKLFFFFRYKMTLFIVTWLVNWDVLEKENRKKCRSEKAEKKHSVKHCDLSQKKIYVPFKQTCYNREACNLAIYLSL